MIYFIFFASVCAFYFNKEINECIRQFASFLEFMHENNPLLLDYYDNVKNKNKTKNANFTNLF